MKKWLIIALIFLSTLQAQAFEDYIIVTKGKLTNIKIEDNTIVDVCPLITIMNNKNTLIVHPLKQGKTSFSVLKNGKEKIIFDVEVQENKTKIGEVKSFEILSLDNPPEDKKEDLFLDLPPMLNTNYKEGEHNG